MLDFLTSCVTASAFGLINEEKDFLLNFGVKYRYGTSVNENADD